MQDILREKVEGIINGLLHKTGSSYKPLPSFLEQVGGSLAPELARRREHLAANWRFNGAVAFLVVINTLTLGIEIDADRGQKLQDRMGFFILNFFYAVAFFAEMLIRQNQQGWDYFTDPWNVFDYSLVVLNCADIVTAIQSTGNGSLQIASTLRVLRLLRVARYIKGIQMFYGMWLVLQGLLDSFKTMLWTFVFLILMVYTFSVALVTLIPDHSIMSEYWVYSEQYLGSVYRTMITILQVLTLDGWAAEVTRPLITVGAWEAVVLIVLVIIICNFGVLNIIIALMVERMSTMSRETQLQNNKVLDKTESMVLHALGEEFRRVDKDSSGELDIEEFKHLLSTETVNLKLRLLGVDTAEALMLFDIMDADKSGSVTPEEFILGLRKLRGEAKGSDLVYLITFTQKQTHRAKKNVEKIRALNRLADEIQERLNAIGKGISDEMVERREATLRNEEVWKMAETRQLIIGGMEKERRLQFPTLKGTEFEDPGGLSF